MAAEVHQSRSAGRNGATRDMVSIDDTGAIHVALTIGDSPLLTERLRELPDAERPERFARWAALGEAVERLSDRHRDVDLFESRLDSAVGRAERLIEGLPAAIERQVAAEDGRLLEQLRSAVRGSAEQLSERTREVRDLYDGQLDPSRDTSTMGRALREMRKLLDPNRSDSVQGTLAQAVKDVAEADGDLQRRVADAVRTAVAPLVGAVEELGKEVRAERSAADAIAHTPLKGAPFEERIVVVCERWAAPTGSGVEHVGADNRPGDIVVQPSELLGGAQVGYIAIECRASTSGAGRRPITRDCDEAMTERDAGAAIYLAETRAGFAKEIGEWAEGETERGPWVATLPEMLPIALRYIVVQKSLAAARAAHAQVDEQAVCGQLQRIRTALRAIKQINTKATSIRGLADGVTADAEQLRCEIAAALIACEDALRKVAQDGED